jgi:hypothetical protein
MLEIVEYDQLKCVDRHANCPQYKNLCNTSAIFDDESINKVCARTCQFCKSMLKK